MKKIIIGIIVVGLVFLIYLTTIDRKIYYLALGDSLAVGINAYNEKSYGYTNQVSNYFKSKNKLEAFVKEFAKEGYRTTDLINDINSNKELIIDNKSKTIQNALIKADITTISIGSNDLLYHLTMDSGKPYDKVDQIMNDINNLFKLVRTYSKEDIYVVGYYNLAPNYELKVKMEELLLYANQKLYNLCDEYNIKYVDIYDLFKYNDYLPNPTNIHPSNEGYNAIANKIIALIR